MSSVVQEVPKCRAVHYPVPKLHEGMCKRGEESIQLLISRKAVTP